MNVIDELNTVFRSVFDNETLEVGPLSTASDVEGWDSLSHVNLIMAIETRFKIRFNTKELLTFKNVGDLAAAIEKHTRVNGA